MVVLECRTSSLRERTVALSSGCDRNLGREGPPRTLRRSISPRRINRLVARVTPP